MVGIAKKLVDCPACNGKGASSNFYGPCRICGGFGYVFELNESRIYKCVVFANPSAFKAISSEIIEKLCCSRNVRVSNGGTHFKVVNEVESVAAIIDILPDTPDKLRGRSADYALCDPSCCIAFDQACAESCERRGVRKLGSLREMVLKVIELILYESEE